MDALLGETRVLANPRGYPGQGRRNGYGHPRWTRLRQLLQELGAASVGVTFESHRGQCRLLSYRTVPERHRLAEQLTQELKAMAQICRALPLVPDQDDKRGKFSWALRQDRVETGYRREPANLGIACRPPPDGRVELPSSPHGPRGTSAWTIAQRP